VPANKTRLTLVRQWGMLRLLPSWPQLATYADIAARLEEQEDFKVDPNTVRRDLEQLSLIFPICLEERGRTHYVGWAKGADPALRTMGVAEAMALTLAEQHLGQLLPTSVFESLQAVFNRAHQTLRGVDGRNPAAAWMHKVRAVPPAQPMAPPPVDREIQERLSRALIEGRQVNVLYGGGGRDEPRPMRLHPLGLILRTPSLYLVATAWDYHRLEDVHLYALHRFAEVSPREEAVVVPEDFDLDREMERGLADFGGAREPIDLEMRVTPELAAILAETPLALRGSPPKAEQTLTPEADGTVRVRARVNDTWQLRWWLRAQASQVREVMEPRILSSEINISGEKEQFNE
jgi:predicted DNA-binding transcriptional regulator YafY